MAFVGIGITSMLMVFVVPKITQIFTDTGKALPWNTRLLMWISEITGDYWWLIILLTIGAVVGFRRWKRSDKGKAIWDRVVLKIWVVGDLVRMVAIARFARTMGTMLAAGVPLLRTLEIVKTLRPAPGKTVAHVEFDRDGTHALVSIWEMDGAIIVYDAKTFEEVKRIPMKKPSGKYNVYNKTRRSAGTSH